jgi:hypothetical protein
MSITDVFCQALQRKSQDILNAIHSVSKYVKGVKLPQFESF